MSEDSRKEKLVEEITTMIYRDDEIECLEEDARALAGRIVEHMISAFESGK